MLKCLFKGHKWEHRVTQTWDGYEPHYYMGSTSRHYTREFYKCKECGAWKSKLFIGRLLQKTRIYFDCPVPQEELK